eukprot:1151279-Pelagomonas_calceolata.AAC.4
MGVGLSRHEIARNKHHCIDNTKRLASEADVRLVKSIKGSGHIRKKCILGQGTSNEFSCFGNRSQPQLMRAMQSSEQAETFCGPSFYTLSSHNRIENMSHLIVCVCVLKALLKG